LPAGNNQNRIDRPIRMKKDPTMSSTFRNFVVQAGATVALTGLLGAVLFTVADFATQGVIA